jgi:hypothetical protein
MQTYDPRYLAGILFFNERAFFEAHEVWEAIWQETAAPDRRFYQGLIQSAVCLFHFGNGNHNGAARLCTSSLNYLKPHVPNYLGLDVANFSDAMERCCARILAADPPRDLRPDPDLIPTITLQPEPTEWPDPEQYLEEEDE